MLRRLLILAVVLLLIAGGGAYWLWHAMSTPYRGFTDTEIFVEIPQGSSTPDIAGRLSAEGVVSDALVFRLAVRMAHADRKLQAGEYRFFDAATPAEIIGRLSRGDTFTRSVTFPEGHTIVEMADMFEKSEMGTRDEFIHAADDVSLVADLDPDAANLEGYLFPSTYSLPRRAGAQGMVRAMVKEFRKALASAPPPNGMSVRDLVTLASIVEKETGQGDERPMVSAVYQNRLRIHMALQCDPTVIYAMMLRHTWNGNIRKDDLQIDSPYNTYRYPGLPPGPIASPGRASLNAVRHPADVPYLYFVGKGDGTHAFASTLAEHDRNVAKYQLHRR